LFEVGREGEGGGGSEEERVSPWITHQLSDIEQLKGLELKFRIEELLRIKLSVSTELRDLEGRRTRLQTELTGLSRKVEELKTEGGRRRNELDRLQISLQQALVAEKEAMERNTPRLGRPRPLHPLRSIPTARDGGRSPEGTGPLSMDSSFDYSLCPISTPFAFHLYPQAPSEGTGTGTSTSSLHGALARSPYKARENSVLRSCLFILLVEDCSAGALKALKSLPNWFGDGRNHLLWLNCKRDGDEFFLDSETVQAHFGRALVIHQSVRGSGGFRRDFDLLSSHWEKAPPTGGGIWAELPPIVPAKRKYLATYLGKLFFIL
jgi:hypothetical protein